MRSCSRRLHLKMLKRSGYSGGESTPLIYQDWFMILLIVLWTALVLITAYVD